MRITEVNITPVKPQNGLVAFASIVVDDCLYLGSIGIYSRLDGSGYRITYPTKKLADKDLHIFHPITKEAGQLIEQAILAKADELFNEIINQ
jgi:DNA-binding cell septation regulator SpoVG